MQTIQELKWKRNNLKAVLLTMDSNAPFCTEEGRAYCQWLVKVVAIELQIEELEKKKAAQ